MDIAKLIETGGSLGALVAVVILFQRQMDARYKLWVEQLNRRDEEWREFLREQRIASSEIQHKLTAEIAANTTAIRELVEASQKHHVYTQDSFESIRRAVTAKRRS